jgi:hypothetical protein
MEVVVAKEETPDQMAARTFWMTAIGAVLFITAAFVFAIYPSSGR